MITVTPAKTTAEPAVADAWAIDSSTPIPVGQLSSVPGHDEQAVVDADGQPDHQGQRGRRRRDRRQAGHGEDAGQRDGDADRGGQQRQPGSQERRERHGEDRERQEHAEDLGDPDPERRLGVHRPAERDGELRVRRGLRGGLDVGHRRRRQVRRGDVELDGRQGVELVRGDGADGVTGERVVDRRDVLHLGDGLDLRLDRGLLVGDRPGRRREDDLAVVPEACGKRCANVSMPRCDSVPGIE